MEKMLSDKADTFHASTFPHQHFPTLFQFTRNILEYKVLEKIGEGSFSEVLKCVNKSTGALYAAKRLKKYYKS